MDMKQVQRLSVTLLAAGNVDIRTAAEQLNATFREAPPEEYLDVILSLTSVILDLVSTFNVLRETPAFSEHLDLYFEELGLNLQRGEVGE